MTTTLPTSSLSLSSCLSVLCCAVLAACAQPGPSKPALPTLAPGQLGLVGPATTGLTSPSPAALSDPQALRVDAQWWKALGDPALEALVDRALADHPSLQAAQARLDKAQSLSAGTQASGELSVGLGLDASRQHYTENGMIPPPIAGHLYNSFNLQVGGSWQLDFFGRHRAALTAALGQQQAAEAEQAAVRQALVGSVVRQYLNLARVLAQREVADRAIVLRQQSLELVQRRVRSGLDTQVELRQAEAAVPDAQTQRQALDEQVTLLRHALATLSVQPMTATATLSPRLDSLKLPAVAGDQLTTDLLGRRADIVAARWRIEAATQGVQEARAQFYPDVQLNAFVGLNALGFDRWLQLDSRQYGVAPAVRLPIFDAGRLRAQLQGRSADLDLAVAAYNGAVLEAVREATDALTSLRAVQTQRDTQAQALRGAEQAHDAAQRRFAAGLGNYLTVLSTEQQALAQRRGAVDLRARALDVQAQLMVALGGGYQTPPATPVRTATATSTPTDTKTATKTAEISR